MTHPRTSIDVTVVSEYLHQQSLPEEGRYAFAYHITITNQTTLAAKLLTRHWIIVDANQERQEIHGSGVVGEQPCLLYTSPSPRDRQKSRMPSSA